jgi:uncharacterized damage-inducible protein DinB
MSKQFIIGDVLPELANTRRILERVPDEHLAWKPHDKSFSLGHLATHIVNIGYWMTAILSRPEYDLASGPSHREPLSSRSAMLEELDRHTRELEGLLAAVDEQALNEEWTVRAGDRVIRKGPRAVMLRGFGLSHLIHHRGQLSVYLRLLNVPVPGLYGPSADDMNA